MYNAKNIKWREEENLCGGKQKRAQRKHRHVEATTESSERFFPCYVLARTQQKRVEKSRRAVGTGVCVQEATTRALDVSQLVDEIEGRNTKSS